MPHLGRGATFVVTHVVLASLIARRSRGRARLSVTVRTRTRNSAPDDPRRIRLYSGLALNQIIGYLTNALYYSALLQRFSGKVVEGDEETRHRFHAGDDG